MEQEKMIFDVVEKFSGVTGIGLVCLDHAFVRHPSSTTKWKDADLKLLDFSKVIEHITESTAFPSDVNDKYLTFFTQNGFVYNIHQITCNRVQDCCIITEPVLIEPLAEKMILEIGIRRKSTIAELIYFREIIPQIPVISWKRLAQLGYVLQRMCCKNDSGSQICQAICDNDHSYNHYQEMILKTSALLVHDNSKDIIHEDLYRQIRYVIHSGDFEAMRQLLDRISLSDFPVYQKESIEFLRTVKDSFTMLCMLECFCAIESGYPYEDAMALAHALIEQTERTQEINAVFTNMKLSISAFTTVVSKYKAKEYSRTTHNVLLYVQRHYSDRISLNDVAMHVGYHPNYISSLVKRETGWSLTDHIKKVRVEMSKYELQHTSRPIAEIAQSVGFTHQNHYARIFKQITGMAPMAFRFEVKQQSGTFEKIIR